MRFCSDDLHREELGSVVDKSSFLSYLIDHCKKSKNINIVDEADAYIDNITSPIKLSQTQSKLTITGDYLIVTDGANSQFAKNLIWSVILLIMIKHHTCSTQIISIYQKVHFRSSAEKAFLQYFHLMIILFQ